MSFVIAVPDLVEAAAQDLAGVRSALDEVTTAVVGPTTGLAPAAGDEVSVAIASLFGTVGKEYHALNAQAAAFHNEFVSLLGSGAGAYAAADVGAASLLSGGGSLTAVPHRRNLWCFGISCSSRAFMQNGIVEVQVQPCSSATGQNRLAENRGWITQVPPTQRLASIE